MKVAFRGRLSLEVPTSMVRLPKEVVQSPLASSQYWKARPPMVMVTSRLSPGLRVTFWKPLNSLTGISTAELWSLT